MSTLRVGACAGSRVSSLWRSGSFPLQHLQAAAGSTSTTSRKRSPASQNRVDSEESGVRKDYESASGKDYAKKIYDTFEQLNKTAKDSTQLVNTAYNLAGYTAPLPEGKIQSSLPPQITLSMSNAMDLAKAPPRARLRAC